jgi:hypothetical protein
VTASVSARQGKCQKRDLQEKRVIYSCLYNLKDYRKAMVFVEGSLSWYLPGAKFQDPMNIQPSNTSLQV